ncbi:allergen V5/Tpx-1 related protein [Streptomyces himastatinicus ATCC 53653]|uniref:Allergen V5/Tpx-1 related protein n=1 Tax=Streptomyces himastatinicus ATCC 53653 TaxID=457427 RepID=D9WFC1_9ACTN|nr:allergen V5/Tpx-1 related protein [Streptomyces himastatinicus ATCC 53653]
MAELVPGGQPTAAGRHADHPRPRPLRPVRTDHRRRRKGRGRRRLRLLQPAHRPRHPGRRRHHHRAARAAAPRRQPGHRRRQPRRPRHPAGAAARARHERHRKRRRRSAGPLRPAAPRGGDGAAARRDLPARHPVEGAGDRQGYADGLAGVARDFGVDVADDGTAEHPPAPPPGDDGFLGLVNAARSRHGVPPVTLDPRLIRAAEAHAAAMAAHGALGAECPDGTSLFHRIAAHGYAPLTVAEHLVSGPRTPDAFVDYCLSGEERRGPLRDPAVTHVGIGRASGAGDVFWTAVWAQPFTPDGLRRFASEVITLTNAERAAARLAPLAPDPRLTAAAQAHSDDMVARDFYDHTSPEGRQPWDRAATAGATHRGIGENIACGQRGPAEVVRGWMNSPGHRANILKPAFTHIGVGYATGSRAGTYWTQVFGASR